MLILGRKINEVICIGDSIRVMLVEDRPGHVKLGIEAPRRIPVHREEVYDAIKEAAASENPPGFGMDAK